MIRSTRGDGILYAAITREVAVMLESVLPHAEGREGGVFRLFDSLWLPDVAAVLTFITGHVPSFKVDEKMEFALEKGQRLLENPGHNSSFQSADPSNGKYGGAIRAGRYVLSFSGLPPHADESLMLLVARSMRLLTPDECMGIAAKSQNEVYLQL